MRAFVAGLILLASGLCFGQFDVDRQPGAFGQPGGSIQFLPVEEAYRLAVEPQADGTLRLIWQIADSYYLYQHRFSFSLQGADGPVDLAVELPPALEREDEFFGDVRVYYRDADILLRPQQPLAEGRLGVVSQGCADAGLCYPPRTEVFDVDFGDRSAARVSEGAGADRPPAQQAPPLSPPGGGFWSMLLLAFLGGTILNLMPCVFPILSLKVLSFTRSGSAARHLHGWLYAAGVVLSFVAVAALLIALQQAGRAVGWGFQLQSPGFVIALAYLFTAMGLGLSGVVQLGSSLMNSGGSLAAREGLAGSFFTGVLAVVVASPCTAPMMGTALGYAVTQPPVVALTVFAALGCGMAAPLLLLSYSSGLRRLMPKPGPWMETLKQALAFPLYATAIWLFWVAGKQTGVNTMAMALAGALLLAMGLWLWGRGRLLRAVAALCLLGGVALGGWRGLDVPPGAANHGAGRLAWSEVAVRESRAAGRPVFVDVTADWCITCIANEQAVLNTAAMDRAFRERDVVYLVADWTNYDPAIAAMLKRYNRTGIPLYLLYPADPGAEPLILPQLLTRSTVLEALDRVGAGLPAVAGRPAADLPR